MLFFVSFSLYPFSYDKAAYAAQNGKWKDAHEKLNTILVDAPDRADVLYDAGIAASNLENFAQAAACFSRAAECTDDKELHIRSYFNAGNALVAHKELKGALDQYEKVFALDPNHQYARHNYDRVKQMLEEEKNKEQQQQQNDDQNDEQEQSNNDQDKQDNKNNDQQDKHNQSEKDKKNQQGNDQKQQSKNDSSENGSDQESKGEQGDETQSSGKNAQGKDHGNKEKNQKQSADNQKRNGDQKSQEQSYDKDNKSDAKQRDKHNKTPEKQLNNSDNASVASEDGQKQVSSSAKATADRGEEAQKSFEQKIQDPWLLAVLNNQEEHDKAINKQLMEAKIHQHGGKNVQNCW
jgi:hypothetical protein